MLQAITAVLPLSAAVCLLNENAAATALSEHLRLQQTPILIIVVITGCLAAAYLALWRAAPDFRAFRTLGIFFVFVTVDHLVEYLGAPTFALSLRAIAAGLAVATGAESMQIPRHRWTWIFWPVYGFVAVALWFPSLAFTADWAVLASEIPLAVLIAQGLGRSSARDRMIAVAFLVYWFVRLTLSVTVQRWTGIRTYASIGGWHWQYTTTTLALLGTLTLAILVHDLIRDRGERQRMAAELAATRAVQQVLIPEEIPAVPGFHIRSVYKPFGEVGGDFFQVLPLRSEKGAGALVIIGDVSGKGMPAAMTVSLLVGTLHTLAHYTQSPGEILAAMNQRMLVRSHGGFTTCLALRAEADGTLTIANAGHPAPYVDGTELQLENGLPLGISASAVYAESTFHLSPSQRLTLLTDGVIEARDKTGALLGFERSASLSTRPAEVIVQAAQNFGQDDDITVISVVRTANVSAAVA
jgi:hypothetical protein